MYLHSKSEEKIGIEVLGLPPESKSGFWAMPSYYANQTVF